jgi:hypothetical protein
VTVYNAFLDSLLQQLEDRFQPATKAAVMLSASFPRYVIDVCFEDVREGCVLFSNYLDGTILDVEIEFESWQLTCGALKDKLVNAPNGHQLNENRRFYMLRKIHSINPRKSTG